MRTLKLVAVAVAVAGAVLLLAPATSQAGKWRGKTEQGKRVVVATSGGKVNRVTVRYLARCGDGEVLRSGTTFRPTFKISARKRFEDGGSYSFGLGNGERARARVYVRGRRASGRWSGDYRVRIRVTKDGSFVTWCRLGKTGWTATRVG